MWCFRRGHALTLGTLLSQEMGSELTQSRPAVALLLLQEGPTRSNQFFDADFDSLLEGDKTVS